MASQGAGKRREGIDWKLWLKCVGFVIGCLGVIGLVYLIYVLAYVWIGEWAGVLSLYSVIALGGGTIIYALHERSRRGK